MSGDESAGSDNEFRDPPSSPVVRRSPLPSSSPVALSFDHPASSPIAHSPPTSNDSGSSEDSSFDFSPVKRRRRTTLSLSSLRRRMREKEQDSVNEAHGEADVEVAGGAEVAQISEEQPSDHSSLSTEASSSSESDTCHSRSSSRDSSVNSRRTTSTSNTSSAYARNEQSDRSDSSDDEGNQLVYEGANFSVNEALYDVLKVYIEERWTKNSLNKNVKLIKKLIPQPNEFPSSGKSALKKLKDLAVKDYGEQEYYYCGDCLQPIENGMKSCVDNCKSDVVENFFIFPPQVQLKHMFEQRQLAEIIDKRRDEHNNGGVDGCVCDVTDGTAYKSVRQHLDGPYDLVVLWNTDGVSMSGSSKQELWPIFGTVCEIPPRLRQSFMLVFGVYIGNKKPNMNVYLKPFVESLQKCFQDGVTRMHHVTHESITSKVVAPLLSADAPAKAMVLSMKRFNARYGCTVCEMKSKKVPLTNEEIMEDAAQTNPRKRIRRQRRFVFQEDESLAPLRTGPRMDAQGTLAEGQGKSRKGVIGPAIVSDIPLFNRADSVVAEYMHLLLLGTVKYFLLKLFFERGIWYVGNMIDQMNDFISKVRVPDFVKRLPRGINDFKFWKASEFRNFLLYYSLPLFKQFLPAEYFQHWLLLAVASFTLLKDSIPENEILSAELMLKAFVRDVGKLYGPKCYTYDVHNLLHLGLLVRRWGPLHGTSAFAFETFNGFISARVHGTKHLGKELVNNINISQSVTILGNIVKAGQERCLNPSHVVLLGNSYNAQFLGKEELAALSCCDFISDFDLYVRIKQNSCIYTSNIYDADKKRINSYVQFQLENQSVQYGEIIVFVKAGNGSVYCLLKTFKVSQLDLLFHENSRHIVKNLVPVEYSGNFAVIPVTNITTKVLKIGMYLGLKPNSIEVNL